MSPLRTKLCRLALSPLILTAALLLPILHVHSSHGHDEGGARHQHIIIHADLFPESARDYDPLDRASFAVSGHHFGHFSQGSFSALTGRIGKLPTGKGSQAPRFFAVALDGNLLRQAADDYAFLALEHSPPSLEVHHTPKAPRSPPVAV